MDNSKSQSSSSPTDSFEDEVERVVADVKSRTLEELTGSFGRLIYLASLRDHNTGQYRHYGLETSYSPQAVDEGLRRCHAGVFQHLTGLSLKDQTRDLMDFFGSVKEERSRLVEVWGRLRSYQVLPPENCHPLARELFEKNVATILRILRETDLWGLLRDPHGDSHDLS